MSKLLLPDYRADLDELCGSTREEVKTSVISERNFEPCPFEMNYSFVHYYGL